MTSNRFSILGILLVAAFMVAPARGGAEDDPPRPPGQESRVLTITHRYLHLPVRTGAAKRRMKLLVGDRVIREFEIELAEDKPEFWVFTDLEAYRGQTITIDPGAAAGGAKGVAVIIQGDDIPDGGQIYREAHRPQFHFTSRRGWLNDPNGLVWQAGVYHLFYQHNPYGWSWGNMHWGHAVSPDLVRWTELPTALYPREFGDWCFSGSAIVDAENTSGFGTGGQAPLVAAFTSTGRGECIIFSKDAGLTWTEYTGNPVVKHAGRDPKLVWFKPGRHWVMVVYDEEAGKQGIAFYTSTDLKKWARQSKSDGFFECPDLFELPVDGNPEKTRWVLHAADGKYVLGNFNGKAFQATSGPEKLQVWYGRFYAAQSFSDTPDGRRIQIGWGQGIEFPGSAFNQQMALPVQLTLRSDGKDLRLFAEPVPELASLRGKEHRWSGLTIPPGDNPLQELKGDLFEINAEFAPGKADAVILNLRGTPLVYDALRRELVCKDVRAPLEPREGRVGLRVFVDRGSIEIFGNDGRVALSIAAIANPANHEVGLTGRGKAIEVRSLTVHELKSAWQPR